MRIRIPEQPGTWRPDGKQLFHFGEYRIPQDMSEELARRAIAEGAATLVEEKAKADSTKKPSK